MVQCMLLGVGDERPPSGRRAFNVQGPLGAPVPFLTSGKEPQRNSDHSGFVIIENGQVWSYDIFWF